STPIRFRRERSWSGRRKSSCSVLPLSSAWPGAFSFRPNGQPIRQPMSASAVPHSGVAVRRPYGKHRHDRDPLASSAVLVPPVHARGPLDAAHVRPFVDELDGSIDAGATSLLVDLSLVDEVTTAGLNGLLAARQRMLAAGGRIAVVLPPRLRRRFQAP